MQLRLSTLLILPLLAATVFAAEDTTDVAMLEKLATELGKDMPTAKPDDKAAYDLASKTLQDSALLDRVADETILWGGHAAGKTLNPDQHMLTELDPRVWRGEYLAGFMLDGKHTITHADGYTVLTMDCTYRNKLDPGDYPYPFWHSKSKWDSYQLTRTLMFLFQGGKLRVAYRGAEEDASRPLTNRTFDGNWHWTTQDGATQPRVSLYTRIFSKDNPHVAELETAYRNLESEARQHNCMACHSPDNVPHTKKLVMLQFPNQALASRLSIVDQLELNLMPPKNKDTGVAGIQDQAEKAKLVELAKKFSELGDKALDYEKQRLEQGQVPTMVTNNKEQTPPASPSSRK